MLFLLPGNFVPGKYVHKFLSQFFRCFFSMVVADIWLVRKHLGLKKTVRLTVALSKCGLNK